jgi:hypothetical protein
MQPNSRASKRSSLKNRDADAATSPADREQKQSTSLGKRSRTLPKSTNDFDSAPRKRQKTVLQRQQHVLQPKESRKHETPAAVLKPETVLASRRRTSAAQPLINGTIVADAASQTPSANDTQGTSQRKGDVKRSLRSHDGGSRSKSELAWYFPNYEQLISNEPHEKGMHTFDTSTAVG